MRTMLTYCNPLLFARAIIRDMKYDRWNVIIPQYRVNNGHLLGFGPNEAYYSKIRMSFSSSKAFLKVGRIQTPLIFRFEIQIPAVHQGCNHKGTVEHC